MKVPESISSDRSMISTHDLLKTFAVLTMIVDHVGYYFYPDDLWFRAVGRLSFPIWFFLIGYARSRDLSPRLVAGGLFLLAMNFAVGMAVLPLNILFTVIILRLILDPVMTRLKPAALWPFLAILAILVFPTDTVFEYGTLALMFAMFGYMVRNKEGAALPKNTLSAFVIATGMIYIFYEYAVMGFDRVQLLAMAAGVMGVCFYLQEFRPRSHPLLDSRLPAFARSALHFCGRRTLEIYIVHLAVFKIAALVTGQAGYTPFYFHIF